MNKRQRAKEIGYGDAVIMKAGLPSQQQIEALNTWRAVVFLQEQLEKRSMRIWEVRPEHLVEWLS